MLDTAGGSEDGEPSPFNHAPNEISIANRSENYCICLIDMVGSSKVTAHIGDSRKVGLYYSIFLNGASTIVMKFGGRIIKNVGDSLIFYFPETSDSANRAAFEVALRCLVALIAERSAINEKLQLSDLPQISYRLSADYGKVQIASSNTSGREDLFGSTMNIIAKIKPLAEPNSLVIGDDLYRVITSLSLNEEYHFRETTAFALGFKFSYPVYSLRDRTVRRQSALGAAATLFKRTKPSLTQVEGRSVSTYDSMQEMETRDGENHLRNIMIVDDNEDMLLTFKAFLSSEQYSVDTFSDAEMALEHFERQGPCYYHLCILDIRMPYMNGLQLYQKLKSISHDVRIMFVSALDAAEELVSLLEINSMDIMRKPLSKEKFVRCVKEHLA